LAAESDTDIQLLQGYSASTLNCIHIAYRWAVIYCLKFQWKQKTTCLCTSINSQKCPMAYAIH